MTAFADRNQAVTDAGDIKEYRIGRERLKFSVLDIQPGFGPGIGGAGKADCQGAQKYGNRCNFSLVSATHTQGAKKGQPLPAFFLHLPTTLFIVLPLTGWAGALYFLITFLAVILRTIWFLVYGRLTLPALESETVAPKDQRPAVKKQVPGNMWDRIKSRLPRRIAGITIYVVPIYSLVFVLNAMGMFKLLREALAGFVVTSFMPMESLSVIILSFAAEFTSGFAAAGALLEAGLLSVKQTVMALLIGNILAFPVRALRHQLPRYIGIFSPKMGTQILLMGQGFRVTSIIVVGIIYYFLG